MNNIKTTIDQRLEKAVLPEGIYETALRNAKKRSRRRFARLAVAAMAFCLIGCAAAAGGLLKGETGGKQRLAALFGAEENGFTAVGNVCSGNAVSVSLDGVYGNDKLLLMAFTAVREDGKPFAAQGDIVSFEDYRISAPYGTDEIISNTSTMAARLHPSSNSSEIHYIVYASGSGFTAGAGETLHIELDHIDLWEETGNRRLIDGTWAFDVPCGSMEQPKQAKAGQRIPYNGDTLIVDEIGFTSGSWYICMTAESGEFSGMNGGYTYQQISLTDTSGKTYSIDWGRDYIHDSVTEARKAHPIFFGLLPQAIPTEEMAYITLFGVQIPLEWQ